MVGVLPAIKPARVAVFAKLTPMLAYCCMIGAIGEIIYGYDVSSFGGVQAIPAFKAQFGTCTAAGVCALSTSTSAIMNSFASIGKFVGCFIVGHVIERFGHKWSLSAGCAFNILGAVLEISAKAPAQFVAGRMFVYFSIAFVEITVTTYQAELVPANMRAFVVCGLQLLITVGGLIATGINKAFATHTNPAGWMIPVGITLVFPVMVLMGLPWIPEAPRWLLFRGRRDDAVKTLKRVRPKADVDAGMCELEIDAIAEALAGTPEKGSWFDLMRGTNRRRTLIVIFAMVGQQLTGQAFVSQYGTVFYLSVGLGAEKSFTYPLISSALTIIPVLGAMYFLDRVGRRPIYIYGGFLLGFWMFCVSGFGGAPNPNEARINMVVASTILYGMFFGLTWAPAPYATAAEMSSSALREKTMSLAGATQSLSAWAVSFVLPYLMNKPYAGLGANVGYIFGSICCLISVLAIFIIPESRGRTLEELDELFERKIGAWHFASAETHGAAHRTGVIERSEAIGEDKLAVGNEHHEMEDIETKA